MTKGNKTRLILTVITLGLLPFSFFVTKALYLQVGEDININISGSLETNTYSVNLYMPDGNGNYTLSNTYDIDTNSNTTINNIIENNNIEFNPINNYIYNGNIYNSESIQTTHNLDNLIESDIDLYPEYIGYFVQGFQNSRYEERNGDMIQLEYHNNSADGYDFSSMVDLGTEGDNYAAQTFRVQYHTNRKNWVSEYDTLHTSSGKYKISYNSSNNVSSYLRYIELSIPSETGWLNDSALIYAYSYNDESQWIDGNTKNFLSIGTKVQCTLIEGYKYSFLINPYEKFVYLLRLNPTADTIWNLSNRMDLNDAGYSYQKYSFVPDSNSSWDWFNLV